MLLPELLKLRTEHNKELTHLELDRNQQFVSNPWNPDRDYLEGMIVYHDTNNQSPDDEITGEYPSTGEDEDSAYILGWFRAKHDINHLDNYGQFRTEDWEPIGKTNIGAQIQVNGDYKVNANGVLNPTFDNFDDLPFDYSFSDVIEFHDGDFYIDYTNLIPKIRLKPFDFEGFTIDTNGNITFNNIINIISDDSSGTPIDILNVYGNMIIHDGSLTVDDIYLGNTLIDETILNNLIDKRFQIVNDGTNVINLQLTDVYNQISSEISTILNDGEIPILFWDKTLNNNNGKWNVMSFTTPIHSINDHFDVSINNPAINDLLYWNGMNWVNMNFEPFNPLSPFYLNIPDPSEFEIPDISYIVFDDSDLPVTYLNNVKVFEDSDHIVKNYIGQNGNGNESFELQIVEKQTIQLIEVDHLDIFENSNTGPIEISSIEFVDTSDVNFTLTYNNGIAQIRANINNISGYENLHELNDIAFNISDYTEINTGEILYFDEDLMQWNHGLIDIYINGINFTPNRLEYNLSLSIFQLLNIGTMLPNMNIGDILYWDGNNFINKPITRIVVNDIDTNVNYIDGTGQFNNDYTIYSFNEGGGIVLEFGENPLLNTNFLKIGLRIDDSLYFNSDGSLGVNIHYSNLNLEDLLDVEINTGLEDGDILTWNKTLGKWENKPNEGGGKCECIEVIHVLELDDLIQQSALKPGVTYQINGVDNGENHDGNGALYNDGTNSGTTIFLKATSENTLEQFGSGIFYNPKYRHPEYEIENERYGIYDKFGNTIYNENDVVYWGGYAWKWTSVSPGRGTFTNEFNLIGDWEKLEYTDDSVYNKVTDYIEYDIENDCITRRRDESLNIDVTDIFKSNRRAIAYMQWGNFNDNGIPPRGGYVPSTEGAYNIKVESGSFFNNINSIGIEFDNIFENNSDIEIISLSSNSIISGNNFNHTKIQSLIGLNNFTNNILHNITLKFNGIIYAGYGISNVRFEGSGLNCNVPDLTLSTGENIVLFDNNSEIVNKFVFIFNERDIYFNTFKLMIKYFDGNSMAEVIEYIDTVHY